MGSHYEIITYISSTKVLYQLTQKIVNAISKNKSPAFLQHLKTSENGAIFCVRAHGGQSGHSHYLNTNLTTILSNM